MLAGQSDIKTYYTMLTTKCNLACPHCDIRLQPDKSNIQGLLDTLRSAQTSKEMFILFGGEPTLDVPKLTLVLDALKSKPIISTNLLCQKDTIRLISQRCASIATSWNPVRFTAEQFTKWVSGLEEVNSCGKKPLIMVTLTDDLFSTQGTEAFCRMMDTIHTNGVEAKGIQFEHYVPCTAALAEAADRWLCAIHQTWRWPTPNLIAERILKTGTWMFDCNNVFTILPDGTTSDGCPHSIQPTVVRDCLACQHSATCRPCAKQCCCTRPHNFISLLAGK